MFNVGRVCVKTAGRDAGKYCVVVQEQKAPYVVIDGETRRKKCNVNHLDPLNVEIDVSKNASKESLLAALKDAGLPVKISSQKGEKKAEPKKK